VFWGSKSTRRPGKIVVVNLRDQAEKRENAWPEGKIADKTTGFQRQAFIGFPRVGEQRKRQEIWLQETKEVNILHALIPKLEGKLSGTVLAPPYLPGIKGSQMSQFL